MLLSLLIVAGLGAAFASLSYGCALLLRSEDALAPLFNGLAMPLLLLSGILLPMSLAPAWLRHLSDVNPLKHTVDATRSFFSGIWPAPRPCGVAGHRRPGGGVAVVRRPHLPPRVRLINLTHAAGRVSLKARSAGKNPH